MLGSVKAPLHCSIEHSCLWLKENLFSGSILRLPSTSPIPGVFDTGGDIESGGRQASVAMQVDDAGTSSSLEFVDTGGDIESSSDCTILDGHAHKRARTASVFWS